MHPRVFLRSLADVYRRFGVTAAARFLWTGLLNIVFFYDCLHIIVLERSALKPLPAQGERNISSRLATLADLERLDADPGWEIGADKLALLRGGDSCILSLVDGEVAGYTWAHTRGRPELIPGLVLSLPDDLLYNYAGFTHPRFRGVGLQPYRHHAVLEQTAWGQRRALLGYVRATNFASQHGQAKSGYRQIGRIWLFGTRRHFLALFSRRLRELGIGRR